MLKIREWNSLEEAKWRAVRPRLTLDGLRSLFPSPKIRPRHSKIIFRGLSDTDLVQCDNEMKGWDREARRCHQTARQNFYRLVKKGMKSTKNNKSLGQDGVASEVLKFPTSLAWCFRSRFRWLAVWLPTSRDLANPRIWTAISFT